jgi:hypothetical protein
MNFTKKSIIKNINIKRALGIIIVASIASLFVTIIGGKIFGVDLEIVYPINIPTNMWAFSIGGVIVISLLASSWYLYKQKFTSTAIAGYIFGILFVVIGFLGDIIALVPHNNGFDILLGYYAQPIYWLTLIMIIISCTLIGCIMRKTGKLGD